MTTEQLISVAWEARENAYAPYSNFFVGAAVLCTDGQVFAGCNVENISYGLTNCAERVAIGAAVAQGVRDFATIVVVAETTEPISPCGACRQVMAEFGVKTIILANRQESLQFSMGEWLPRARTGILGHG